VHQNFKNRLIRATIFSARLHCTPQGPGRLERAQCHEKGEKIVKVSFLFGKVGRCCDAAATAARQRQDAATATAAAAARQDAATATARRLRTLRRKKK
jgi:hypothetical protein